MCIFVLKRITVSNKSVHSIVFVMKGLLEGVLFTKCLHSVYFLIHLEKDFVDKLDQ